MQETTGRKILFKLAINSAFADVIKASVIHMPKKEEKHKDKPKKK